MDDATYGALALALTLLGGGYTWWAFRNRGAVAGTRGAALTLLPPAAYLTGTLRMLTRIVDAVGDWALRLVFSPTVWLGVTLAALSVTLFVVAGFVGRRGDSEQRPRRRSPGSRETSGADTPASLGPASGGGRPVVGSVDDDLADIEAILKKRGIT